MNIQHEQLRRFVQKIFAASGCHSPEGEQLARQLVESNLVGHDSHGVIRIPRYLEFLNKGMVRANRQVQVVFESDVIGVLDGQLGFGQSVGEQAMQYAIERVPRHGVSVTALRNSGHLGRIGQWASMGAAAGLVSMHWVNANGMAILVAPYGGFERRLSATPISIGVPLEGSDPIVLDISTAAIAEGKLRVALNKGELISPDCVVDSTGKPTINPVDYYTEPRGSILTFGAHKGYGLSFLTEILAGALTGSGCSDPAIPHLVSGMLTILIDPQQVTPDTGFQIDVKRLVDFVKSSQTIDPSGEILLPGEPEARTRAQRLREGIEVDDRTWDELVEVAESLGVAVPEMTTDT